MLQCVLQCVLQCGLQCGLQCVLQCGLQCVLQCEKVMNGIKRDLDFALIESRVTMGWLRSVGSIKLSVSFAEYSLFYRALLLKRPIILSILLTVATPYATTSHTFALASVRAVATGPLISYIT